MPVFHRFFCLSPPLDYLDDTFGYIRPDIVAHDKVVAGLVPFQRKTPFRVAPNAILAFLAGCGKSTGRGVLGTV